MVGEHIEETEIGTPQGGNLSPLLANIILNELDWELGKAKTKVCEVCGRLHYISKKPESCPKSDGLNYKIY